VTVCGRWQEDMLRAIVQLTDILQWTSPDSGSATALLDSLGAPRQYDVILYYIPPFVNIEDREGKNDPVSVQSAGCCCNDCRRFLELLSESYSDAVPSVLTRPNPIVRAMHYKHGRLLMARSAGLPLMCCRSSSPRVESCSATSILVIKRLMLQVCVLSLQLSLLKVEEM
jgi:hypothetical protein